MTAAVMSLNQPLVASSDPSPKELLVTLRGFSPADALQEMRRYEEQHHLSTIEDWTRQSVPHDVSVIVSWYFYRSVSEGMLEQHDQVKARGLELQRIFPQRSEGYYLEGMASGALGDDAAAVRCFERGRVVDEALRGAPTSQRVFRSMMAGLSDAEHRNDVRKRIQRHAARVQACQPNPCGRCGFQSNDPTPLWMCPPCFMNGCGSKNVLLWEPDSVGSCHGCNNDVSAGNRHHCRSCGWLHCSNCTPHLAHVSILGFDKESVRICNKCRDVLATATPTQRGAPQFPMVGDVDAVRAARRNSLYSVTCEDDQ